jgi:hypothetical protein
LYSGSHHHPAVGSLAHLVTCSSLIHPAVSLKAKLASFFLYFNTADMVNQPGLLVQNWPNMDFIFNSFNTTSNISSLSSLSFRNHSWVQRAFEKPKLPEDDTKNMQSNGGHLNSNLFPSTPGLIPAL